MKPIALIIEHEGWRNRVCLDSLGIPTVGVGFNLIRADGRTRLENVGADYDLVLSGQGSLTEAHVMALLQRDILELSRWSGS